MKPYYFVNLHRFSREPSVLISLVAAVAWSCGKLTSSEQSISTFNVSQNQDQLALNSPYLVVKFDDISASRVVFSPLKSFRFFTRQDILGLTKQSKVNFLAEATSTMTVRDPLGAKMVFSKKSGNQNWEVPTPIEGTYVVEVVSTHPKASLIRASAIQKVTMMVDHKPPQISLQQQTKTDPATGEIHVKGNILASDAFQVECSSVELEGSSSGKNVVHSAVKLRSLSGNAGEGTLMQSGEYDFGVLKVGPTGKLFVKLECFDKAKNVTKSSLPAQFDEFSYSMVSSVNLNVGVHASSPQKNVFFAGRENVVLTNSLVSGATQMPMEESLLLREKGDLRVAISSEDPADAAKFFSAESTKIYPWAPQVEAILPQKTQGFGTIYVALVRSKDGGSNEILNWQSFDAYYDFSRPSSLWKSGDQFFPAVAGTMVSAEIQIEALDAGEDVATFKLDYSSDNETWLEVAGFSLQPSTQIGVYTVTFPYPLAQESPFRVKLKGKDLAKNSFESVYSRNLIGRSGLVSSSTEAEQNLCGDGKSFLKAQLASSFACTLKLDTGKKRLFFSFFNKGKSPFQFSSLSGGAMGYKVVSVANGNSSSLYQSYLNSGSSVFNSADLRTKNAIRSVDLSDSQFGSSDISVVFDVALDGQNEVYSSEAASACYPQEEPRPSVVVKGSSVPLSVSPFLCEN